MCKLADKLEELSAKAPCTQLPMDVGVLTRYLRNGANAEKHKPELLNNHAFEHDAALFIALVEAIPDIVLALRGRSDA